jgi:hypothetical protein
MRYDILFAPEAVEDFENLAANVRAEVRDGIERHLPHEPATTSKSRIKRLRGLHDRSIACVSAMISACSTTQPKM